MSPIRSLLPFLTIIVLALLVAACGSDETSSNDSEDARDAGPAATEPEPDAEPGSEAAVEAKTGAASLAITPELTACMTKAGFTQDSPAAAGGVASWTHPDGARIVVAPSSEAALSVASEVGTTDSPASVDGARVSVGAPALTSAAAACLDA
jgi:hypothetical protein